MNDQEAAAILAAHNAWRRYDGMPSDPGAPQCQDARELGLAMDRAIAALSAPPPPNGGEARAKQLEWMEESASEWSDRHHGFHITKDDEEPEEERFTAAWGEGDPEWFPTLEEAQAWCQEAIDRYIREWAVTPPPSVPAVADGAQGEAIRARRQQIAGWLEALQQAAQSLRTIANQAGKVDGMEDLLAVRGYAYSRARVAEAAFATQPGGDK